MSAFTFGASANTSTTGSAPTFSFTGSTPVTTAPSFFGGSTAPFGSSNSGSNSSSFFASPSSSSTAPTASTTSTPAWSSTATMSHPSLAPALPWILRPNAPFSSLPPNVQQALDGIHTLIMRHRKTMNLVKSMAPDTLARNTITSHTEELTAALNRFEHLFAPIHSNASQLHVDSSQLYSAALQYLVWPLEALATRRHVQLTPLPYSTSVSSSSSSIIMDMEQKLREALLQNATLVDRIESLPSPFLWNLLADLEYTCIRLNDTVHMLKQDLDLVVGVVVVQPHHQTKQLQEDVRHAVQAQTDALLRIASQVSSVHDQVEQMKHKYRTKISSTTTSSSSSSSSRTTTSTVATTPLWDTTNLMHTTKRSFAIGIGDGYNIHSKVGSSSSSSSSLDTYKKINMEEDPFLAADLQEMEEDRKLQEEIQRMVQMTAISGPNTSIQSYQGIGGGGGLPTSQTVNTLTGFTSVSATPNPSSNPSYSSYSSSLLSPSSNTINSGGIFGNMTPTTTTTTVGFPTPTSSTPAVSSLFSTTPSTTSSIPSSFTNNAISTTTTTTTTSMLGGDGSTMSGGLFGASSSSSSSSMALAQRRKSMSGGGSSSSSSLNRKKR